MHFTVCKIYVCEHDEHVKMSYIICLEKFGCTINPNPCHNGGVPSIINGACVCRCPEGLDPANNCLTEASHAGKLFYPMGIGCLHCIICLYSYKNTMCIFLWKIFILHVWTRHVECCKASNMHLVAGPCFLLFRYSSTTGC